MMERKTSMILEILSVQKSTNNGVICMSSIFRCVFTYCIIYISVQKEFMAFIYILSEGQHQPNASRYVS